jgi:2-keto-4-pentenoate hydratase/2-oxohepta-3-ene-1,7-dioic acid hydratase in catechol pathway
VSNTSIREELLAGDGMTDGSPITGTTLEAGTLIMTGTPPGIGFFREPKYSLNDGDEVVISITALGKLSNTMRFE